LRNHQIATNGTLRDTVVYSIIAAEWPTVRAHLTYQLNEKPRAALDVAVILCSRRESIVHCKHHREHPAHHENTSYRPDASREHRVHAMVLGSVVMCNVHLLTGSYDH
jgi:hypothetical protein